MGFLRETNYFPSICHNKGREREGRSQRLYSCRKKAMWKDFSSLILFLGVSSVNYLAGLMPTNPEEDLS